MCLSIPARIVEIIDLDMHRIRVDAVGVVIEVSVAIPDSEDWGRGVGDWVLVHDGYAIAGLGTDEALERSAAFGRIRSLPG